MKEFLKIYAVIFILTQLFLFFGGYVLFDLSRHYYLAGAMIALIVSIITCAFLHQESRIEALENRIETLENGECGN